MVAPRKVASTIITREAVPILIWIALLVVPVDEGFGVVPVPLSFFARSWKAWKLRADDSSELIALEEKGEYYDYTSVIW